MIWSLRQEVASQREFNRLTREQLAQVRSALLAVAHAPASEEANHVIIQCYAAQMKETERLREEACLLTNEVVKAEPTQQAQHAAVISASGSLEANQGAPSAMPLAGRPLLPRLDIQQYHGPPFPDLTNASQTQQPAPQVDLKQPGLKRRRKGKGRV